jgi:hypothetical protein
MRVHALAGLVSLLMVSGCDAEQPLAKSNATRLKVSELELKLTLEVKPEPPCALLPKVTAKQNDVVLTQLSAGARVQGLYPDLKVPNGPAVCEGPVWEMLPVNGLAPVTFVLEDSSGRITAEVGNLQLNHGSFRLVSPATGPAHPRELITAEWSPTDDVLFADGFSGNITMKMGGSAFILGPTTENGVLKNPDQISTEGSRVTFAVPSANLFTFFGAGELSIGVNGDRHFLRCEGVPACTSPFKGFAFEGQVPITIAP